MVSSFVNETKNIALHYSRKCILCILCLICVNVFGNIFPYSTFIMSLSLLYLKCLSSPMVWALIWISARDQHEANPINSFEVVHDYFVLYIVFIHPQHCIWERRMGAENYVTERISMLTKQSLVIHLRTWQDLFHGGVKLFWKILNDRNRMISRLL